MSVLDEIHSTLTRPVDDSTGVVPSSPGVDVTVPVDPIGVRVVRRLAKARAIEFLSA